MNAAAVGGTKSIGGLGQAANATGGMLKAGLAGGIVAAWTAIIGFGVASVQTFNDLGQAVLKFQRASGATAEEASALIAAFDDVGIEAEAGSKAIFQLGKRLETSTAALAAMGITAVKNKAGNTDLAATLGSVADAYVQTADQGKRNAMVLAAFGKSGQDLIPILERGSAGIKELYASAEATGQILSQEDIDKTENFRLAMDDLQDSMRMLTITAGQALVPALTRVAEGFTSAMEKGREFGELPIVKQGRGLLGEIFKGATGGFFEAATGMSAAAKAMLDAGEAAIEEDKNVKELTKALFGAESATRAVADAKRTLERAQRTLTDANDAYNKLLKEGAVDEEKVADARTNLAEATRSLADANRGVAKSQEEYNDAQAAFLAMPSDTNADKLADAGENLADAHDTQASASERAAEAAKDLREAQAGDPEFQKKLAAAKQTVIDAEVGLKDAQHNSAQQAYELDAALKTQSVTLLENSGSIAGVRTEWETLLALKPEIMGFLAGPLATLGQGTPAAGFRYGGAPPAEPAGAAPPLSPAGTGGKGGSNVVINVTEALVDPVGVARKIIWNLN